MSLYLIQTVKFYGSEFNKSAAFIRLLSQGIRSTRKFPAIKVQISYKRLLIVSLNSP